MEGNVKLERMKTIIRTAVIHKTKHGMQYKEVVIK